MNKPVLLKAVKALIKKATNEEASHRELAKQTMSKGVQTIAFEPCEPKSPAQTQDTSFTQALEDIKELILDTRGTLTLQQQQIEDLKYQQGPVLDHQRANGETVRTDSGNDGFTVVERKRDKKVTVQTVQTEADTKQGRTKTA